jgi:teichuronic acid biosynthesis protein TuaE
VSAQTAHAARGRLADAGLLLGGVAAAAVLAVALVKRSSQTELVLAALAAAALVVLGVSKRRLLARVRTTKLLGWVALLMPLAALIGPALAPPGLQQLFAFRLLLALAAVLVVAVLLAAPATARWRMPRYLALFGLWFVWLAASLIWAADKQAGFRYLLVFATMLALAAATAFAGTTGRRLKFLIVTLGIGYALTIAVTLLEAFAGFRLSTSALVNATGSRQLGVTAFYFNQNNLATYLTIAWAFLLTIFLFTRRRRLQVLTLAALGLGLFAFVRTGSRSSLLVIGLETVALAPLLLRLSSPRAARAIAATAVVVVAGLGFLAFNSSENPTLRQFNLTSLVTSVEQGAGSGATRLDLTRFSLTLAGRSYLLGVGPGNAEPRVKALTGDPTDLGNLHDWWLEVLVDGGLPALVLYLIIYFGLAGAMYRVARRARDAMTRYLALSVLVALIGYAVGCLGPSTAIGFAPMWILFGLALAVIVRAEGDADERRLKAGADAAGSAGGSGSSATGGETVAGATDGETAAGATA